MSRQQFESSLGYAVQLCEVFQFVYTIQFPCNEEDAKQVFSKLFWVELKYIDCLGYLDHDLVTFQWMLGILRVG